MNLKKVQVKVSLAIILATLTISCEHDVIPSCEGVELNIDVLTTAADPAEANGSLVITADGPAKYFTYSMDSSIYQASNKFIGLDSGNYIVYVRNSWGCIQSKDLAIAKVDPCLGISLTSTAIAATLGKSDGQILATLTGGSGFQFNINGGAFQTISTFKNLKGGNYIVSAKDSLGCFFSASVTITETDPCDGVTITVTGTATDPFINTNNGKIVALASGATGFTYSINGGAFQNSGTFNNLSAGNYTVVAKSSVGCLGTTQVTLTSIDPCANVTITITTTLVNPTAANNGSITAIASGSTGFTYNLNGGTYQTSGTFNSLSAGNYTISAKNLNGCIGTTQVALGAANPCAGVTVGVTASIKNATIGLNDGGLTISATGGSGFTYSLNGGAYGASNNFSNLAAGTYTVGAKNSSGCLGSGTFTVGTINPCAGVTVIVTGVVTNATAGQANGVISVSATGGTGFTYSLNGAIFQTSGNFIGLAAGSYTITAKNSSACQGSATFTVGSTNPCAGVSITLTSTTTPSENCVTPGTGSITVAASGSSGYTYSINSGAYQTNTTFTGLTPGTFIIGVKDTNGCTATSSITVNPIAAGPKFIALKTLIQSRCSGTGCHTNGQTKKGYNFDTDCKIVTSWNGINGSCITGNLARMPIAPQPNLTAAEKQVITDWINAGHLFSK
jgi:hypothetical protein